MGSLECELSNKLSNEQCKQKVLSAVCLLTGYKTIAQTSGARNGRYFLAF